MAVITGSYGFAGISASIKGFGGFADLGNGAGAAEEGITIEPVDDQSTAEIGADGSAWHSLSASTAHNLTVRLAKLSPVNTTLMVMASLQQSSPKLNGKNVISIRDSDNGDYILCEGVAFTRWAPLNYGKTAGTNEWTFFASSVQRVLGGL